ncbi:unnamed protein product [Nezara viridula]|uniref:Uncharacterized protein n=1 Tax=Nezara viridula TaxID=85310 RepID=A0A9P0HD24_NEZVI|nr:unnamed protein product [Nezara viridula]
MLHHYNEDSGRYECSYCIRSYEKGVILYRHLIYECLAAPILRNQLCPYCKYRGRSKRSLVVHMAENHIAELRQHMLALKRRSTCVLHAIRHTSTLPLLGGMRSLSVEEKRSSSAPIALIELFTSQAL